MAAKAKDRHKFPMIPFCADQDCRVDLDLLISHFTEKWGVPVTRSDVIRKLISDTAKIVRKKISN